MGTAVSGTATDVLLENPGGNVSLKAQHALGVSAQVGVPVNERWGARVTALFSNFGVDPYKAGGGLLHSRFQLGVVHNFDRRGVCGYTEASAGAYRFWRNGTSVRSGGVAGTFGLNVPSGESADFFVEFQLALALNTASPPLGSPDAIMFSASAGFRHRF
jgi:hypothetical protein